MKRPPARPAAHDKLLKVYKIYNARYFNNALPKEVGCIFGPIEGGHAYGYAELTKEGWRIVIDPGFYGFRKFWKLILLHEMAHIHCYPDMAHGRKFQREMLRLGELGALRWLW